MERDISEDVKRLRGPSKRLGEYFGESFGGCG